VKKSMAARATRRAVSAKETTRRGGSRRATKARKDGQR
jgi:hypothetical protein